MNSKEKKKNELKRCTIWRFRFICPVEARCTWLGPNIWNSKAQKGIRKSWSGNGRKFQIYSHHHLPSRRPLTSFNGYFSLFSLSLYLQKLQSWVSNCFSISKIYNAKIWSNLLATDQTSNWAALESIREISSFRQAFSLID